MTSLKQTIIKDVFEINQDVFKDKRGYFLNCFRKNSDFIPKSWKDFNISQVNISCTDKVGSIRGLHLQSEPYSEFKIVRCIKGLVWDVAVDLRKGSNTYKKWVGIELCSKKKNSLLIPKGCAHGFQVLKPSSELLYLHSGDWVPSSDTGIKWDDPILQISWPLKLTEISTRDNSLPYI